MLHCRGGSRTLHRERVPFLREGSPKYDFAKIFKILHEVDKLVVHGRGAHISRVPPDRSITALDFIRTHISVTFVSRSQPAWYDFLLQRP